MIAKRVGNSQLGPQAGGREGMLGLTGALKPQSLPQLTSFQQGHTFLSFPNSFTNWDQVLRYEPSGAILIQSTTPCIIHVLHSIY